MSIFDVDDGDRALFKASAASFVSIADHRHRDVPPQGLSEPLLDGECPDAAEATVEAAEAIAATVPFPLKAVLSIIASQLLSMAPTVVFAAIAPYIYGVLVGDLQTAGTASSVAAGFSMMMQVLVTPVLAQVMDLYGRKKLAV